MLAIGHPSQFVEQLRQRVQRRYNEAQTVTDSDGRKFQCFPLRHTWKVAQVRGTIYRLLVTLRLNRSRISSPFICITEPTIV